MTSFLVFMLAVVIGGFFCALARDPVVAIFGMYVAGTGIFGLVTVLLIRTVWLLASST